MTATTLAALLALKSAAAICQPFAEGGAFHGLNPTPLLRQRPHRGFDLFARSGGLRLIARGSRPAARGGFRRTRPDLCALLRHRATHAPASMCHKDPAQPCVEKLRRGTADALVEHHPPGEISILIR